MKKGRSSAAVGMGTSAGTGTGSGTATGAPAPGTASSASADIGIPGKFRTHCLNKTTNQWYEVQDLFVTEANPQLIGLSESYLLLYEKK